MTGPEFLATAIDLQRAGRIVVGHGWKSDLARKIGRRRLWVDTCLARGTDQTTDLALAALMAGLEPYRPQSSKTGE